MREPQLIIATGTKGVKTYKTVQDYLTNAKIGKKSRKVLIFDAPSLDDALDVELLDEVEDTNDIPE